MCDRERTFDRTDNENPGRLLERRELSEPPIEW